MRQKKNIDRWLEVRENCNKDLDVAHVDWSQLRSNAWITHSTQSLHIYYSDWHLLQLQFVGMTYTISREYVSIKKILDKQGSVSYQIACYLLPCLSIQGVLLRDEHGNYYLHSQFGGRHTKSKDGRIIQSEGKIARLRLVA